MRTVRDGDVLPGVSALLLAGHTPGGTGWLIESRNQSLLVSGDIVHLASIQVLRPDAALVFDVIGSGQAATCWSVHRAAAEQATTPVHIWLFPASVPSCATARVSLSAGWVAMAVGW